MESVAPRTLEGLAAPTAGFLSGGMMDRRDFVQYLAFGAAFAPSAALAQAAGSRQRQEIEVTVHKDPG